jgi:hypothetical protein
MYHSNANYYATVTIIKTKVHICVCVCVRARDSIFPFVAMLMKLVQVLWY